MGDFTTLDRTAAAQYGLLTTDQLLAGGFTVRMIQSRVASGVFRRRHRGVVQLAGTRPCWEQDLEAAVLAAGDGAAASHRSAARLWGFRSVDDELELSIRYPRRVRIDGAIVHRSRDLQAGDITEVNGIATTTPERTIVDLGLVFPLHEVGRVLRHAVATGLVNRYDLWRMRYRTGHQGRDGTGVLGQVLRHLPAEAEQAESGLEVLFLEVCNRFRVPTPALQLPVKVGDKMFRLDFAWPAARVFVEVDGYAFHATPEQIDHDDNRQNLLVTAGWTPLRFTHADLTTNPARCIEPLRRLLGFVDENRP